MFQIKVVQKIKPQFQFHYNLPTITGTLHADRYTVLITSRSVLLRMRNVSDKICRENQNTPVVFSNLFPKNRSRYAIMWDNMVEWGRAKLAIWRMHIACCIPKATNTHSEYVTLIAFPPQQWFAQTLLNVTLYIH
jgi:hypothetical protein